VKPARLGLKTNADIVFLTLMARAEGEIAVLVHRQPDMERQMDKRVLVAVPVEEEAAVAQDNGVLAAEVENVAVRLLRLRKCTDEAA